MAERTITLVIEYEGTRYAGWQRQKNHGTVQEEVEKAVRAVTGLKAAVTGAGRTDAGAHALGQAAHFSTASRIPAARFGPALNAHLPEDIAVRSSEEAAAGFHARFSARGKLYRYVIWNDPLRPAVERNFSHHVREALDISRMKDAAKGFLGRHDFAGFRRLGTFEKNTVREIRSADLRRDGPRIVFEVEGTAFLYAMVRTMIGTLVEIGRGKLPASAIPAVLESRNRKMAGPTLPAKGLFLVKVIYA